MKVFYFALVLLFSKGALLADPDHSGRTPLHMAVLNNQLDTVLTLLEDSDTNVNEKDELLGETPLHYAVNYGFEEIVRALLKNEKVEVNCQNLLGETPLHLLRNSHKIATLLIKDPRVDLNAKRAAGETPLHSAVSDDQLDVFLSLLEVSDENINRGDDRGHTPLHYAAEYGHKEIVRALLKNEKIDVNSKNQCRKTPLHLSIGHHEITSLLACDPRTELNAKDSSGDTALHILNFACDDTDELQQLLISKGANVNAENNRGQTPLHRSRDCAEILLKAGADPNVEDAEGCTPLLKALCEKRIEAVKALLRDERLNIYATAESGKTALHLAAESGCVEGVQLLLSDGRIDVNARDDEGNTALHLGAKLGDWLKGEKTDKLMSFFLEDERVNVNVKDQDGATALHIAARANGSLVIDLLLGDPRFDPNARDNLGHTPLHSAALGYNSDAISALLKNPQVDPNAKDPSGQTPLHLKFWGFSGGDEISLFVNDPRVDVNAQDSIGYTPLHTAIHFARSYNAEPLISCERTDFSRVDNEGRTPLMFAIENQDREMIEWLSKFDPEGAQKLPLEATKSEASHRGEEEAAFRLSDRDIEIFHELIESQQEKFFGALSNEESHTSSEGAAQVEFFGRDEEGQTPFHRAIMDKDLERIQALITHPKACINSENSCGLTPLGFAIEMSLSDMIKALLEPSEIDESRGASAVDIVRTLLTHPDIDVNGGTSAKPIYCAAKVGNNDLLRLLMEDPRIDINAHNRMWHPSALCCAIENKNREAVKLLLSREEIELNEALDFAAWCGDIEIFQLLVAHPKVDLKEGHLLHIAAREGSLEIVKLLLKQPSVDLNAKNDSGWTPLQIAIMNEQEEIVKLLLSQPNIKVNIEEEQGIHSPLALAAANYGETQLIQILLEDPRVDVNIGNPLHVAIENGRDKTVESLLADGRISANSQDSSGRSALFIAAEKDRLKSVQMLIDKGADVNAEDRNGSTPLHTSNLVARTLLKFGADPNKKDAKGHTPFHTACIEKRPSALSALMSDERVNVFEKTPDGKTALHLAAENGQVNIVQLLINDGRIDPNTQDNKGSLALHLGVRDGKHGCLINENTGVPDKLVRVFLEDGRTDIDARDGNEMSALHLAAQRGATYATNMLVKDPRVDPNAKDHLGRVPLHLANKDCAQILLKNPRVDPNAKDCNGRTALHMSFSEEYRSEVVPLLVNNPLVDVNIQDQFGYTPLHTAIACDNPFTADPLLNCGRIKLHLKDNQQRTALDLAIEMQNEIVTKSLVKLSPECAESRFREVAKRGDLEAVRFLLQFDFNVNSSCYWSGTALHIAATNGHIEILKLLLSDSRVDLNTKNYEGATALHLAIRHEKNEAIKLLLGLTEDENLPIQNSKDSVEESFPYSFTKAPFVPPYLINDLSCGLFLGTGVNENIAVDIWDSKKTLFENYEDTEWGENSQYYDWYSCLGVTDNGVCAIAVTHRTDAYYSGVIFVVFEKERVINDVQGNFLEKITMKRVGEISLGCLTFSGHDGDRYAKCARVQGNKVLIYTFPERGNEKDRGKLIEVIDLESIASPLGVEFSRRLCSEEEAQ